MTKTCFNCGRDDDPDVAENLRDQLAAAEAERDRYLTRACVAEAKVEKVRELLILGEQPPVYDEWESAKWDLSQDILTAIGGKP